MSGLSSGVHALLGVVFALSAGGKLTAFPAFVESLRPLRFLPRRSLRPVAAATTATESILALGFASTIVAALGVAQAPTAVGVASLIVAGLLLTALTAAVALALRRGWQATCACFGATPRPLRRRHLVRNGLLLAAVVIGLAAPVGAADIGDTLVALASGALAAVILVRLDDLFDLLGSWS